MARRILWLTLFGIAFGYLEAAVVVYLRELYYPEGFAFPLVLPDTRVLLVELGRELATLLMLLGVAMVAGRTPWERFGAFAFLFGVWDLVYYAALWGVLGWPETLLTWDVLFLIPLVWAGPVLSAVLVAASLVVAGVVIMKRAARGLHPRTRWWVWGLAILSLSCLLGSFMANHGPVNDQRMPDAFPWPLHLAGMALGWIAFGAAWGYHGRHEQEHGP
jgi:hypothetical protein